MKPISNAELKDHIYVMLRQADLDVLPDKFPINDWLRQRADETRVQTVYKKVKAELDREFQAAMQKMQGGRRTRAQRRADADELIRKCGTSSAGMTSTMPSAILPNGKFGRGALK